MRSAMRATRQLPGREPTVVDMALYLHVNQKSNDDDDDDDDEHDSSKTSCADVTF